MLFFIVYSKEGITLDIIENQSSIEYEYKINPNQDPLSGSVESNTTSTELVLGQLAMVKTVDKQYATIGDTLTYTTTITNSGTVLASDIVFKDIIPNGATFVTGSVVVDGVSQPTYNPNTGFNVGSLLILGSRTITFQVTVTSLPSPNTLLNQSTATFNYVVIIVVPGSSSSNTVTTTINVTDLDLVKTASADYVESGDTLSFTTVITNNGNINATNIIFTDTVSSQLTFVTGSVVVNGTPQPTYDPNVGFNLGTLAPGASFTVTFDTTVN
jgi:uncharacterized repeat protein (TIGR01451 family)